MLCAAATAANRQTKFVIATCKTFARTLVVIEWCVGRIVEWNDLVNVDGMDVHLLVFV